MGHFLQDYHADALFTQIQSHNIMWWSKNAAVEIAMLGFPEDSNAILHVLNEHGQFDPADAGFEFQCIWSCAGLSPPGVDQTSEGAVWVMSNERLREDEVKARDRIYTLPDWVDWNHVDAEMLEKMQREIENPDVGPYGSGLTESRRTAAYAAVVAMASDLDRPEVIADVMPKMVQRIHDRYQWDFLRLTPAVWKDYLLKGWLREQLGLDSEDVQAYARYVLETAKERFEKGPRSPASLYHNLTLDLLLDMIDQNTISDPKYKTYLIDLRIKTTGCDYGDYGPGNTDGFSDDERRVAWDTAWQDAHQKPDPTTIFHHGAAPEQILEAEKRIGRELPDDIKSFFGLTNGCDPVRENGWYRNRLPSLEQIFLEKDGYMDDYGFQVVPGLPHQMGIEWPGFPDGGIAMYEHDGQGTQYVWIVGAESIRQSKKQLQIAYDKASDKDKAVIDSHIKYFYGSREAYDAMNDHCYYEVAWGDAPQAIYPTFHAYLASIAAESRHHVNHSPLKVDEDEL